MPEPYLLIKLIILHCTVVNSNKLLLIIRMVWTLITTTVRPLLFDLPVNSEGSGSKYLIILSVDQIKTKSHDQIVRLIECFNFSFQKGRIF